MAKQIKTDVTVEEYEFVDANGKHLFTISFHPTDVGIVKRYEKVADYLNNLSAKDLGLDGEDETAAIEAAEKALEEQMNQMYDKMAEATDEEMASYMEETGLIQELLSAHDFYMIDAKVEEVGRALGLAEVGLDRDVTELSGGQRTKVLLGKLLLEKPDILLLDEPTNYLDVEHIEWLKRYLNDYENAFILISHDIPFLNSVVNLIYHMDNQQLNRYVGDYDKFQEVYAMKKAQLEAAYNKQQKEIADLKYASPKTSFPT